MKTTKNITVSEKIVDQVIGQDEAVTIIKKAAQQRRHVLLIGEPGTGKSMLGLALAELLPNSELKDVLALANPNDNNNPLIKETAAGKGREEVKTGQIDGKQLMKNNNLLLFIVAVFTLIAPWWVRHHYKSDLMFTAFFLGGMLFLAAFALMMSMGPKLMRGSQTVAPKVIVDNFGKKQAPFFDATGAHAGALLGDVLHDPFQTFFTTRQKLHKANGEKIEMNKEIDRIMSGNAEKIRKREKKNYEAIFLSKGELTVLGELNGSVSPVEVLSSNRYDFDGEMIKLTTSENKELIVTPEHKVAILDKETIKYVEARKIKEGDQVVAKSKDAIIDEQDIINTYDARQQEQCRLFYQYQEIKKANPAWGYKRIAKAMNQPIGKTRWWHAGKHIPVPIQTSNWLKQRGLLPLKIDNLNLPIIAKIIGATFGDGGIFENLNGIFLSSKEKYNVEEFQRDIETVFSLDENKNSRIIEGGEYGHSWCYQNTNRNVIRFFVALKSPVGKKSCQPLLVPNWIYLKDNFQNEFYSSLLGSEAGVPNIHVSGTQMNTFDFAITGEKGLEENRNEFLHKIIRFLESVNVKTGKISQRTVNAKQPNKSSILHRFLISTEFQNLINYTNNCKLNYCRYKREKLTKSINTFKNIKLFRYEQLISQGYGAESAMQELNLTPSTLYQILNDTEFLVKETKAKYGET